MPAELSVWPDVLDDPPAEEDLTQGLHSQDTTVTRRVVRRRGVPTRDRPFVHLSDSEVDAPRERLQSVYDGAGAAGSSRSVSGQSLEYRVTASLLSLSSGRQSRRSGSTGPRTSDERRSSSSSAAPRSSTSGSKEHTPNSSRNRRGLSLPNLPVDTLTEEDDIYESALENVASQDHSHVEPDTTFEDPDATPLSTQTIEHPHAPFEATQSLEVLDEATTDSTQQLDPAEYPYMKNMGAASLVYGHKRNSSLLKQAASFFSLSPGMELRSSTVNILGNGQTLQEAASEDEGYTTARSSVSSNFCHEFVIQLPCHFEPQRSKLNYQPTASPYHLAATPHELRKAHRASLREKNLSLPTQLSLPSTQSSPPRHSHSTPSSPHSDISSHAQASDTFLPRPRQTVVQINPIPIRGNTFDSAASSVDVFRFLPNKLRTLPPNALLFIAGFLFFPCFWIGAFYPRLKSKDQQPWSQWKRNSQVLPPDLVTEEKLKRYSWRGQHEGVLPNEQSGAEALPRFRRLSDFLAPDPRTNTSPSYWANQKAVHVWRQRCRVMSLLSVFLLIAIIVAAALTSKS